MVKDARKKNKPFILRADVNAQAPFEKFLNAISDMSITILKDTSESGTRKDCISQTISASDYLNGDYIYSGWHLSKNFIRDQIFKEFESDLFGLYPSLLPLLTPNRAVIKNIWLSPKNKFAGLHYDSFDNFNLQLSGSKTFYICPPYTQNFYRGKVLQQRDHTSEVKNIFNYDPIKYPEFEPYLKEFYKAEIGVGDILYLPSFWWHQVHTGDSELSINLNWWYMNYTAMLRNPKKTWGVICLTAYRKLFQKHLA